MFETGTSQRFFALALALIIAVLGCSRPAPDGGARERAQSPHENQSKKDTNQESVSSGLNADGSSLRDPSEPSFFRTAVDLRNNRFLAHLHRDGLVVPLNDPGVTKYLPRQTKSGLKSHVTDMRRSLRVVGRHGVLSVSLTADSCRDGCWLYLGLEQRIKKQYLGIYVNKHAVRTQLVPEGPSVVRARIPPGVVVDGENRLRFYFARKGVEGGARVSADLYWLAISPREDEGLNSHHAKGRIIREKKEGLNFRDYFAWTWNLAVPSDVHLEVAWEGEPSCPVRVQVQRPESEGAWVSPSHSESGRARFDLGSFVSAEGGILRLRIERTRETVLHDARLVVPHRPMRALGEKLPRKVIIWLTAGLPASGRADGSERDSFESLKKKGIFFPNAVAQSPTPWRSFTGILSGLPPHEARNALSADSRQGQKKLLPWLLKKKNWSTALFSGEAKLRRVDMQRAFQEIYDFQPVAEELPEKAFLPHLEDWLEANKKGPFFAVVAPWSRRAYYRNRKGYTDAATLKAYRGTLPLTVGGLTFSKLRTDERKIRMRDRSFIEALAEGEAKFQDKLLGELVTKLQELELADETLLVVVGAAGVELFEHGSVGVGHTLHRETTTVPILFVHPGSLPEGVTVGVGAELIDVAPTVLSALGFVAPATMKGANLLNLVKNEFMSPPRAGFSRRNAFERSLDLGSYRLMRALGEEDRVFDLNADPEELSPLRSVRDPAVCALKDAMSFHVKYATWWRKARHGQPSNQSETFAEDSKSWWGDK